MVRTALRLIQGVCLMWNTKENVFVDNTDEKFNSDACLVLQVGRSIPSKQDWIKWSGAQVLK